MVDDWLRVPPTKPSRYSMWKAKAISLSKRYEGEELLSLRAQPLPTHIPYLQTRRRSLVRLMGPPSPLLSPTMLPDIALMLAPPF